MSKSAGAYPLPSASGDAGPQASGLVETRLDRVRSKPARALLGCTERRFNMRSVTTPPLPLR